MANKNLFKSLVGMMLPKADAVNEAGAPAYRLSPEQALAQYAMTGCMNATFYASAEEQLKNVIELAEKVPPPFLARLAVYAREKGYMKDLPALFCAILSVVEPKLLEQIFERVIDNGKMLRNFVQIMRSGAVGRKSLGSMPKRLVREWISRRPEGALFADAVGNAPSLADVIKMVHPKPEDKKRATLYRYLLGREHDAALLPEIVRHFEDYKSGATKVVPCVPFQMLTALPLGKSEWTEIARNASWQTTRMNLNTFMRHGVLENAQTAGLLASRLTNKEELQKAHVFPYQLLVAYLTAGENVPRAIREALQDAMEIAVANVPTIDGQIVICPDVSGSMQTPVTGRRGGATTKVRCIDIAALVAAAFMRKNSSAVVLPFERKVVNLSLNPRDSIMTNAHKLAAVGGGGTNCSAPLVKLNRERTQAELVVLVSDNESWVDATRRGATATMQEWEAFKARNPKAKLVCIDIQPYATTQAQERSDILNVGGFSDQVFEVIAQFAKGTLGSGHFVELIEKVEL